MGTVVQIRHLETLEQNGAEDSEKTQSADAVKGNAAVRGSLAHSTEGRKPLPRETWLQLVLLSAAW